MSTTATFGSHHILTWIVIGLVSGALAARLVHGKGYGCLINVVVGLAGAFVGGIILHEFAPPVLTGSIIDDIVVSFLGAVILLGILRLFDRGSRRRR